jgi:hypothetical protein
MLPKTWCAREEYLRKSGLFEPLLKESAGWCGGMDKLLKPYSRDDVTDLDANGTNYLIVDSSTDAGFHDGNFRRSFNRLVTELVRHISSSLPSIALKTGTVGFSSSNESVFSGIEVALDAVNAGTPVLFLDCFERPFPEHPALTTSEPLEFGFPELATLTTSEPLEFGEARRQKLIEWAKDLLDKEQAERQADGRMPDLMCSMKLAWLYDVFTDDGDARTIRFSRQGEQKTMVRLHEAISNSEGHGRKTKLGVDFPEATSLQIDSTMQWLAYHQLKSEWLINFDPISLEDFMKKPETKDRMGAFVSRATALLTSGNFHSVNLAHSTSSDVGKLVQTLVRLDRLPTETSLEGLLILRQCWDEYDVAQYLAGWYKLVAKLVFALQLLLAFSIVVAASLFSGGDASGLASASVNQVMGEVVFGLSLGSSFLISLDSFLGAKAKWRQLRTFAGTLASIIWQYRCRVPPFQADSHNPDSEAPTVALREALIAWRTEMASGADLNISTLRKRYKPSVYRHSQYLISSEKTLPTNDDHHSPVHAADYITMRLVPTLAWYRSRIPTKNFRRTVLKLLLLVAAVMASVLARYSLIEWSAVVTAFASLVTAWSEFSDNSTKVERYNRAIATIENLLSWWESMSPVQKASRSTCAHLIVTGEAVISEERLAWQSTAGHDKVEHDDGNTNSTSEALTPRKQTSMDHGHGT